MVVSMINSSVSNKIQYNLIKSEGGPNPSVMHIKQENSSKGFNSFRTVKVKAEGFPKPILQEYVVIFCKLQTEP